MSRGDGFHTRPTHWLRAISVFNRSLRILRRCSACAGYGIADVNYGGSTGYGREYRNRLRGNWGIVDMDDCCNAAKHLASEGKADAQRLCISGGSAGGYTTLACLAFRSFHSFIHPSRKYPLGPLNNKQA